MGRARRRRPPRHRCPRTRRRTTTRRRQGATAPDHPCGSEENQPAGGPGPTCWFGTESGRPRPNRSREGGRRGRGFPAQGTHRPPAAGSPAIRPPTSGSSVDPSSQAGRGADIPENASASLGLHTGRRPAAAEGLGAPPDGSLFLPTCRLLRRRRATSSMCRATAIGALSRLLDIAGGFRRSRRSLPCSDRRAAMPPIYVVGSEPD